MVNARLIEDAAQRIRERRRYAFEAVVLAAALAGLAVVAFDRVRPLLGLALAAGAVAGIGLAGLALLRRRELVAELAIEPSAYDIPEVARFGNRLVAPRERARLARSVQGLVREARRPRTLCVRDRVLGLRHDLEELASDLVSPAFALEPACAARLQRMLTYAAESPFYNANLPPEDARAVLFRIRAGLQPRG